MILNKIRPHLTTDRWGRYLLLLALVLPLLVFRDFTRNNELRYLVIADEAIGDGHVFAFFNQGVPYADKPPLHLWMIMAGRALFGQHCMLFLSLLSMVPALVILRVMDRWAGRELGEQSSRSATQLMLFTAAFFFMGAGVVRMDMLMSMFIVLALYWFYRLYSGERPPGGRVLFAVFVFLGIFSKGPMGLLIPLVSTVTFLVAKRQWKKIGYYWGWVTWGVLILLCGVWFAGVYLDGGSEYLENLLFKQTAGRAVNAYHHREPIWFYGIAILYALLPWIPLTLWMFIQRLRHWRDVAFTDVERFFLSVGGSTFVMLSLISGKVDIYLLPVLPFFIYLTGLWIGQLGSGRASKFYRAIHRLAWGVLGFVFVAGFFLPRFNSYIGLGDVTRAAMVAAKDQGITRYYTYGIARGEQIEAYTGVDVVSDASIGQMQTPAVLIGRERSFRTGPHFDTALAMRVQGLELHTFGPWFYVILPEELPQEP